MEERRRVGNADQRHRVELAVARGFRRQRQGRIEQPRVTSVVLVRGDVRYRVGRRVPAK